MPPLPSTRDAARSRAALLDAAEELFARDGYERTSLEAIGARAGLSRGAPRYFFDSKEGLYRAVLTRIVDRASTALAEAHQSADRSGDASPQARVEQLLADYIRFLSAEPTYLRLIQWEALGGAAWLRNELSRTRLLEVAVERVRGSLGVDEPEARRLVVAIAALCWLPFAHADTLLEALGLDRADPAFLEAYTALVTDLLARRRKSGAGSHPRRSR